MILTIDDDASIRNLIRSALVADGHAVMEAEDGLTGIEKATVSFPDLILLDVEMPGLDGREVVRRLKADPVTREIPVIMLTGLSDSAHAIGGLGAGADEYLAKPIPVGELRARVRAMLRLRALQQELVSLERERQEARLAVASEVQRSLLPAGLPRVPGFEMAVRYHPCEALGGDFYDVFDTAAGPVAILGDAEGHGPAAALWMATARAYLIAGLDDSAAGVGSLLARVNTLVSRDRRHTALLPLLCLRIERTRLVYANAGHEGPVLVRPGTAPELLDSTGPLLGMTEDSTFDEQALDFPAGSVLIAFTDGLTDAIDGEHRPFGRDRVQSFAREHAALRAEEIADALMVSWRAHAGSSAADDVTIFVLKRTPDIT